MPCGFKFWIFLALPILTVGFSILPLIVPLVQQIVLSLVGTLSEVKTVQDLTTLLQCMGQNSITPQASPYLLTDAWLNQYGYTVSNVTVTTADGYILKVFRVTGSPNYPNNGTVKPAIYVNHGLAGTSNQWLIQVGQNNLITQLADNGYDVWIGNCRGNSYSQTHVNMSASNISYWDFSWHEMGIYDVPAVIDKIISVTGQSQIYYLGYSMGTTQIMVLLSMKPEYNAKIKLITMYAPAAIINSATTPLRAAILLTLNVNGTYLTDPTLGGRINANNQIPTFLGTENAGSLCAASSIASCGVCANMMFFIFGYDPQEMNYTSVPAMYTNGADVIGTKCVIHYAQHMNDAQGRFRQFDYGQYNQQYYNQPNPPEYNLSAITAPIIAFYGRGDILCPKANVETLFTKFAPGVIRQKNLVDAANTNSAFNHWDFITGVHDYPFLIQPTLQALYTVKTGGSL